MKPVAIRMINQMGHDLGATGLAGAARSLVPLPDMYYQLADLAGLLRQNPQLKDRLENYPAFLSLAERDDFKQLGQDSDFQSAWESSAPIAQFLSNTQVKAMLQNNELTTMVLGTLAGELDRFERLPQDRQIAETMIPKKFSAGGVSTSM